MKVVKPTPITAAMLVSTTATETYAAWNGATAYTVGDTVLITITQRLYERLISGTTATSPDLDAVNWLDVGPTNKWAMFDREISTATTATTSMTVVVKPGYVNSIGFFGLVGATLEITVRDALAGNIVYGDATLTGPLSASLNGTVIGDWYQYFFEPNTQLTEFTLSDLPPYTDAHITVKVLGSGTVACGILDVGNFYDIGEVLNGASVGITDYSRKDTDEFGVTSFVRRGFAKRLTSRMLVENAQLNKVVSILSNLRATPCTWIGTASQGYEVLSVFGFYRDFSVEVAYPTTSFCSLEIEGTTQ